MKYIFKVIAEGSITMDLKNKKISFLGDSITEGCGVADIANCRFDNRIAREFSAQVYNYGVGGSRLAHQSVPSEKPRHDLCFCGRAYDLMPDSDIIVVYGGVNDYLHGDAPIGTPEDKTPATFCGAVNFLMNFLSVTYPAAKIVFFTPAHCFYDGHADNIPSARAIKKPDAMPLCEYSAIIKKAASAHGIPVCDLAEKIHIDPTDAETRADYIPDGLHFNDAGHAFLARAIADFLLSL